MKGNGNGRLDAVSNALKGSIGIEYQIFKYENYSDTEIFTCEFDSIQNLKKCLDNIYSYGQGNQMYFILYNI